MLDNNTLIINEPRLSLVENTNPILHKTSQLFTDDDLKDVDVLQHLSSILINEMYRHDALGVSACQFGIDRAIFVMQTFGTADENVVSTKTCINPQIVAAVSSMKKEKEGCLSFPGLELSVNRPEEIMVRYFDLNGKEVTEHLVGLDARIWLHEYDHCNGICFTDRVSKLSLSMAKKKLEKTKKRNNK